jgi:hypothetical protein
LEGIANLFLKKKKLKNVISFFFFFFVKIRMAVWPPRPNWGGHSNPSPPLRLATQSLKPNPKTLINLYVTSKQIFKPKIKNTPLKTVTNIANVFMV